MGKYKAQRTNGFASKLESAVYDLLKLQEKLCLITDIQCQRTVVLQEGGKDVRIAWKVDFSCSVNGKTVYVEAKGIETNDYKLKLKLWKKNPPAELIIYKGHYSKPFIAERILCKS